MDRTFSSSSSWPSASAFSVVSRSLRDAAAVLLPVNCAGCGRIDRALCDACAVQLAARPRTVRLSQEPVPSGALAHPVTCGALDVEVSLGYEGVAARVLSAVKEHDRTDVLGALVPPMRAALRRAAERCDGGLGPPVFVTVPSARRSTNRRGFRPVDVLARSSGFEVARRPLLRLVRQTSDQAGLDAGERQANLQGAIRASAAVASRDVILVDDVLTTGATLLEVRRAVTVAGGRVIAAACLAHTAKRKVTGRELVGDTGGRPY